MYRPSSLAPARAAHAALLALLAATAATAATAAAASPAAPARAGDAPTVVLRVPWGDGPAEAGRRGAGEEVAPEGPMSFAVAADGGVALLDQVHRRVLRFGPDGKLAATVPLPADTYQDLALLPGGDLLLLDRLARRALERVTPKGAVVAAVPVEGDGVPEGGGVTALLLRRDGAWLEYDHRRSLRVADGDGKALASRAVVTGRPADAGVLAHARLAGPRAVEVWTVGRADDVIRAHETLAFERPVWRIAALEVGEGGELFLAVHLLEEGPAPDFAVTFEALEVRVLAPDLTEQRRFPAAPSVGAHELFREFSLGPDGALHQLAFTAAGVEVRRW